MRAVKDQLLTIVDALLMARAELEAYSASRHKDLTRTIDRLEAILQAPKVSKAMGVLVPGIDAPSVIPSGHEEQQTHAHDAIGRQK